MVLWLIYTVILFLCGWMDYSKADNDFQRISSFPMQRRDFLSQCINVAPCRYSKIFSALKENYNLDAETSSYNLKVKKDREKKRTEGFDESDNLNNVELDIPEDLILLQGDDRNDNFLNAFDQFDTEKPEEIKRGLDSPINGCDCKIKNDLLDLGHLHYPRYLINAVCHKDDESFEYPPKCWRGAQCRPLEYKVRVLTYRSHNDHLQKDPNSSLLPDVLRSFWKFKTVTIAAGCFCS